MTAQPREAGQPHQSALMARARPLITASHSQAASADKCRVLTQQAFLPWQLNSQHLSRLRSENTEIRKQTKIYGNINNRGLLHSNNKSDQHNRTLGGRDQQQPEKNQSYDSSLSNPLVFTQLKVSITKAKTTGTSWQCRHSGVSRVKSAYSG